MKTVPAITGQGVLTFPGFSEAVGYEFKADAHRLSGRGSLAGAAPDLRAAFKAGESTLILDDGHRVRIMVTAHTEGGETAYFEAVDRRPGRR